MNERHEIISQIRSSLGQGTSWRPDQGPATTVWTQQNFDLLLVPEGSRDSTLRSIWHARSRGGAQPVIVIAPSQEQAKVSVLGPQDPQAPVRTIPVSILLELVEETRSLPRRQAASVLATEFIRLDESGIPGVAFQGLLTRHFIRDRLRWPANWSFLTETAKNIIPRRNWQENMRALGYQVERTSTGYLLRLHEEPVAVLHAYPDPSMFSHATDQGALPEGLVLTECNRLGAGWGILATHRRFRLFQNSPPVGAATGRYLEIDLQRLSTDDRPYAGMLAPESLKRKGRLEQWVEESLKFGDEIRKGLENRLRLEALPSIARGLGEYLDSNESADLSSPEVLRDIEAAALTLVFRFVFTLYAEAAGFLPLDSPAYRHRSATELAAASRRDLPRLDKRSTTLWDSLMTLVRMVRTGNRAAGVAAYNGSLFAASGFPGSELLERSHISDNHLAPALAAIAYAIDEPDAPGIDYAGLEISYLGAIYEGLLGLKLTSARQNLRYDEGIDRYLPARVGDQIAVQRHELFYQTETGGRKAAGVFYTRHEFVRHLVQHSLVPALDSHLEQVTELATKDPVKSANQLFDFKVVDPAMGSAHFLTVALDMMADHLEGFLADHPLPPIRELLDSLKVDSDGSGGRVYEDSQLLRRLIIKRCIYGIDISPMAVEIANISLWLASFVPGLALSYMGSNLKVGDALIGVADLTALRSTSPLFSEANPGSPLAIALAQADSAARALAEVGDRTPDEVALSREKEGELQKATEGIARCLNLWCAEPLDVEGARHVLETGEMEKVISGGFWGDTKRLVKAAEEEAERRRFFHWPLAFPTVFLRERPGFDVVIGNPPWNEVTIEKLGFYALRDPGLRGLTSETDRQARIQELTDFILACKRSLRRAATTWRPSGSSSVPMVATSYRAEAMSTSISYFASAIAT